MHGTFNVVNFKLSHFLHLGLMASLQRPPFTAQVFSKFKIFIVGFANFFVRSLQVLVAKC